MDTDALNNAIRQTLKYELAMLEDVSHTSLKNLLKDEVSLRTSLTACVSTPLESYDTLSPMYRELFDNLFELMEVQDMEQARATILRLKAKHYYESTAFITLFQQAKRKKSVSQYPPRRLHFEGDGGRLWLGCWVNRLPVHLMAISEHYLQETEAESACELVDIPETLSYARHKIRQSLNMKHHTNWRAKIAGGLQSLFSALASKRSTK